MGALATTIIAGLGALAGGASAAAGIEGQAEARRQAGQAQDRARAAMGAEQARQAEVTKRREIGETMLKNRARQRALAAGRGGRQDTILTAGVGGGDGGGTAGQMLGAGGGKTLLGA